MRVNDKHSKSGEQVAPKTPAGSTSPVHQERIALQENTAEDLHLTCRLDPEHPGEWRCISVPGPVVPNGDSSVSAPSVDTPLRKSDEGRSKNPDGDEVEIWNRNGETMSVKRIEHEGKMLFLPIAITSEPQHIDPQAPLVTTAKLDLAVGRPQMSRWGSGGKGSCKLTGMRSSTSAKKNDQNSGRT
jgi:hypothetical protein